MNLRKTSKRNALKSILIGIITVILTIIIKDYINIKFNKENVFINAFKSNYYKIEYLMNDNPNSDITDGEQVDFAEYVIKLIMEDVSSFENDRWIKYNRYFNKEQFSKIYEELNEDGQFVSKVFDNSIAYIRFDGFTSSSTENIIQQLETIKSKQKLIIDLRYNSGGYLNEAIKIMDLFVEKNITIASVEKASGQIKSYVSKKDEKINFDNIVILISENTSSVSELMVVTLLNTLNNVITIGTNTYGKNIECGVRKFSDGSGFIFITGIMKGANDTEIPPDGIKPDFFIKQDDADIDTQLQYAIEYLSDKNE